MSEWINNRNQSTKQTQLKQLIKELHDGKSFEEVKSQFAKQFGRVSATEITQLEHQLIEEGMPVIEVQRLCDVHSAVFKGSIEDIHSDVSEDYSKGHPIQIFLEENKILKTFFSVKLPFHIDQFKLNSQDNKQRLVNDLLYISQINAHYSRKENLLFPYLEKYGVYGPAKVMWGKDDEVRLLIKETLSAIEQMSESECVSAIKQIQSQIEEMIFKEENILFPMAQERLTRDEWVEIDQESDEIGYSFIEKSTHWIPKKAIPFETSNEAIPNGEIRFETGLIKTTDLEALLNVFPVDITFIDQDDVVRYFNRGTDRIFPRTKAVIGRTVQNCHPPKSVHIVEKILNDFKSGIKDHEDFWIKMHGLFVYIRYFAVRDAMGKYLGTLEFTQEISSIIDLKGEKRLSE